MIIDSAKEKFFYSEKSECSKKFDDLKNKSLYFIVGKVECDDNITSINLDDKKCFALNNSHINNHILNSIKLSIMFLDTISNAFINVLQNLPV